MAKRKINSAIVMLRKLDITIMTMKKYRMQNRQSIKKQGKLVQGLMQKVENIKQDGHELTEPEKLFVKKVLKLKRRFRMMLFKDNAKKRYLHRVSKNTAKNLSKMRKNLRKLPRIMKRTTQRYYSSKPYDYLSSNIMDMAKRTLRIVRKIICKGNFKLAGLVNTILMISKKLSSKACKDELERKKLTLKLDQLQKLKTTIKNAIEVAKQEIVILTFSNIEVNPDYLLDLYKEKAFVPQHAVMRMIAIQEVVKSIRERVIRTQNLFKREERLVKKIKDSKTNLKFGKSFTGPHFHDKMKIIIKRQKKDLERLYESFTAKVQSDTEKIHRFAGMINVNVDNVSSQYF